MTPTVRESTFLRSDLEAQSRPATEEHADWQEIAGCCVFVHKVGTPTSCQSLFAVLLAE